MSIAGEVGRADTSLPSPMGDINAALLLDR
jgi:hypothetical protein